MKTNFDISKAVKNLDKDKFAAGAVKVAKVAVPVLTIAGTLLGNWLGQKQTEETISKKVAEALSKAKE